MTETKSQDIADRLERFIRETFHVPADDPEFDRKVHLYEQGYVDSIGVTETIAFIERTFEVSVPPAAVFDPDFTHVDGMARYIANLRT